MKIIMLSIYLLLTTSGLVLMKLGGNTGALIIKSGTLDFSMSLISCLGFVCYIGSFLIFTRLVNMFNLSYIYPISAGIVQILTLVASYFILKEPISVQGIIGAVIIIIGIVIMNIKS